jgi:[FeFe] hydrogenase H-cluster maturation GTPase HydF
METTPRGERIHIGLFGRMNVGKSSLMNAITNQNLSIVSSEQGTTTDPVFKSMEILPLGPVVLMDTPGLDDQSILGLERIKKAQEILKKTDLALLVLDARVGITKVEEVLLEKIKKEGIPYILIHHKEDLLLPEENVAKRLNLDKNELLVSSKLGYQIEELRELMGATIATKKKGPGLLEGLVRAKDVVFLVVPIDGSAPKGRLILPQQQVIRDILDCDAVALVVQVNEVEHMLKMLSTPPNLVITDSQVFNQVKELIPNTISLTSFSILFARYKGDFSEAIKGAEFLDQLKDGDQILMAEGCTHHRQCGDIGTEKLPKWLKEYTKKELVFTHSSGQEFKSDLEGYALIIHCGGCMLSEKEMRSRNIDAIERKIPMTNYGMTIAKINGILDRSLEPFFKLD